MTLHTRAEWEALEPRIDHKRIYLHHTAGDGHETVPIIDDEHKRQGWEGIGYHRLIQEDGTIHEGRPDTVMGAQAKGDNAHSIGVAVAGNFMTHLPNAAQWKGLVHCLAVECKRWGIPVEHIYGHRDVARLVGDPSVATACPGDALYAELPHLRQEVAAEMARL